MIKLCLILKVFIVDVSLLILVNGGSYENTLQETNYCKDLKSQTSLDMEQLLGMWNGVEIIQHKNEFRRPSSRVCPVILIAETEDETSSYEWGSPYITRDQYGYQNANVRRDRNYRRQHWRNLSLLWDEGSYTTEYNLRYELAKPGLWISTGPHNSSHPLDRKYKSFTGHIQVLKVVATHLVLTFCHISPNEFFTIILSRIRELTPQDLSGIHSLISRRDLPMYNVQSVCRSNAYRINNANLTVVITLFILFSSYFQ